jgi:3-oxoadipate enol-lactonase
MLIETERCGRLFVEVRGKDRGPTLCFWHSLLSEGGSWTPMIRGLEARYRIVNIDAPGHGRSGPVSERYSMDDSVDAAIAVLDALSIDRCVWIGLSWGGMVGMRLALRVPERLQGLVLFDTSAHRESRRKLPSYFAMAAIARRIGATPRLLDRIVPLMLSQTTRDGRPEIVSQFRERLAAMDPASIGHAVDAVIFRREDMRSKLPSIRVPTLVICGEEDVATPPSRSEAIASGIRGAQLRRIRGAAHLSAWEDPSAALAHVQPWLDALKLATP